jgi:hypothetical protein
MRHELAATEELARKLDAMERARGTLKRWSEEKFSAVFERLAGPRTRPPPGFSTM